MDEKMLHLDLTPRRFYLTWPKNMALSMNLFNITGLTGFTHKRRSRGSSGGEYNSLFHPEKILSLSFLFLSKHIVHFLSYKLAQLLFQILLR